jgi:hypothetical protein
MSRMGSARYRQQHPQARHQHSALPWHQSGGSLEATVAYEIQGTRRDARLLIQQELRKHLGYASG